MNFGNFPEKAHFFHFYRVLKFLDPALVVTTIYIPIIFINSKFLMINGK